MRVEMGIVMLVEARTSVILIILLLFTIPSSLAGEKINLLMAGHIGIMDHVRPVFDTEPLIRYTPVPARDTGGFGATALDEKDLVKMIRLYFPRTYDEMKSYDILILTSPEYYLFTPKQDQWMYDAINEGIGGLNDGSVFSIVSGIAESWSSSLTQRAFPNDAPAVTNRGAGEAPSNFYQVKINQDVPDPILTPFIPYGVERVACVGIGRMVIHRQGSNVLAWTVGAFPQGKVDLIAAWNYGEGRAITSGEFIDTGWLQYPREPQLNQYSPEIIMNMVFWLTKRNLIDDIEIFRRIKASFRDYRSRITVLISLKDFIEKYGANTERIQEEVGVLEDIYRQASGAYLDQDFVEAERVLDEGFKRIGSAETIAKRVKNNALLWVYVIEWLVATSTLFISGTILWTLMVKRRLYREVEATRLSVK
jgi:hypothetical protein